MKLKFILFLIFYLQVTFSQTSIYKIRSGETSIGNLSVTQNKQKGLTEINVTSQVKVKLFIEIDLKYKLSSTYKDSEFIFGSVTTYVNGKVHTTTTTEKTGDYYTITKDGHQSKFLNKINYSGAMLYFNEPKDISLIYSEFDAINKPIKLIETQKYQVTNPKNGRLSEYIYKDGVMVSSVIHHALLTFTLTKI